MNQKKIIATSDYDGDSIRCVGFSQGNHGGRFIHIRQKPGMKWQDFKLEWNKEDVQGNPHEILEFLGETIAAALSFTRTGEGEAEEFTVPDTTELNGCIDALNEKLTGAGVEPICLKFYEVKGVISENDYLEKLEGTNCIQIPRGNSGNTFYHDTFFHLKGVLIPYKYYQQLLSSKEKEIARHVDWGVGHGSSRYLLLGLGGVCPSGVDSLKIAQDYKTQIENALS